MFGTMETNIFSENTSCWQHHLTILSQYVEWSSKWSHCVSAYRSSVLFPEVGVVVYLSRWTFSTFAFRISCQSWLFVPLCRGLFHRRTRGLFTALLTCPGQLNARPNLMCPRQTLCFLTNTKMRQSTSQNMFCSLEIWSLNQNIFKNFLIKFLSSWFYVSFL